MGQVFKPIKQILNVTNDNKSCRTHAKRATYSGALLTVERSGLLEGCSQHRSSRSSRGPIYSQDRAQFSGINPVALFPQSASTEAKMLIH